MNFTEALAFVRLRGAISQEPEITETEVTQFINELAVTEDADENAPTDEGWTPTYSRLGCYRVLAELWETKASRTAHRFDFLAPTSGGLFKVGQIHDHCMKQARKYRNLTNQSVRNAE